MNLDDAKYLIVNANVRHWVDATVNGVEDVGGKLIPCRSNDLWLPKIRLCDGQIMSWPEGTSADIHYKVCDAGEYFLADFNGKQIAKWNGHYVPDDILAGGDGYGDYIILKINGDGKIENWKPPVLDESEWEAI